MKMEILIFAFQRTYVHRLFTTKRTKFKLCSRIFAKYEQKNLKELKTNHQKTKIIL